MFRSFARRKLRTALTVLGIAVGIWALIVMSAMANKLTALEDGGATYFDNKIVVSDAGNLAFAFGLTPMPIGIVEQIEQIPGVAVAAPQVQFLMDPDDTGSGFAAPDFVVASTAGFDQDYETFRTDVARGREIALADEGSRVTVLGAGQARKSDMQPGDLLDVRGETFGVVGILKPTLMFFDATAFIPLEAGQDVLAGEASVRTNTGSRPPLLTSIVIVYPEAGAGIGGLIESIEATLPQTRAVSGDDFDSSLGPHSPSSTPSSSAWH